MLFPDSFIDELKQRLPVSKVISTKVPLKRYGTLLKGLCPFHKEKTPSFTVHDHKGIYYCFGCHASGDIIQFLIETEKSSFSDSIKSLAIMAGMDLPKLTKLEQKQEEKKNGLVEIVSKASEWYAKQLTLSINHTAYEYFIQRGLTEHDIKTFSLGFAPYKGLLPFLIKSGFSNELAVEAGLAIKTESKTETYIDRFRNRIIFPIRNKKNQIVGFGGRTLSNEVMPKYLNSPETPLFKKNNLLYAADIAYKQAIKNERVIVVEGYMDAIFMHKAGLHESVAALGTAFNEKHLYLLWNMANEAILCFDGDSAGKKAMLKAAHIALTLLEPGLTLRFCFLPQGKDPDEIYRQYGESHLHKLVNNSTSLADFIWQSELELSKSDTPEAKALFEHKIYNLVKQIKDQTVANHYKQFMKDKLWREFSQRTSKKNIILVKNTKLLPLIQNLSPQDRLIHSLFAQLLANDSLVLKSTVFNDLSNLEIDYPELENLRSILTKYYDNNEKDDKTSLNDLIIAHNLGRLVDLLCGKESSFVNQISAINIEIATENWHLTYKKYTLELLKTEYNQFMKKAYHNNEVYTKAEELKKSIDSLAQEITKEENNF